MAIVYKGWGSILIKMSNKDVYNSKIMLNRRDLMIRFT